MADENKDLPNATHPDYKRMQDAWKLCRDLREGTDAIHKGGERYLPRHPAEDLESWRIRAKMTELYNGFGRTVVAMTGLVFQRDPELAADAPELLKTHWENIDGAGNAGPVFAGQLFDDAMTTGRAGVLVDYPPVPEGLSLAAEQALGARPYWQWYEAENVLSWRTAKQGSATVLTQIVLREYVEQEDGVFGTAIVTRYRVFRRAVTKVTNALGQREDVVSDAVEFEIWETPDEEKKHPVRVRNGTLRNQTEIPFAPLMPGARPGTVWGGAPPLKDLADVNLAHYQVKADRRYVMHLACVPVPVRKGLLGRSEHLPTMAVGPAILQDLPIDGDFSWAEVTGTAFQPTKEELDTLERQMGSLGMAFLASETRAAETAEAKRIDAAAQNATLARSARALRDCLENAFRFHAKYLRMEPPAVTVNKEFEEVVMDPAMITALSVMEMNGQLSLDTFLKAVKNGHVIPEDVDVEEEKLRILASGSRVPLAIDQVDPTAKNGNGTGVGSGGGSGPGAGTGDGTIDLQNAEVMA